MEALMANSDEQQRAASSKASTDSTMAEQTKAFHRSALGKAMRDGPLVCKIRVETEGRDQQPVVLRWEAKSRAEWMASEGDIAFRFHVSIDRRRRRHAGG